MVGLLAALGSLPWLEGDASGAFAGCSARQSLETAFETPFLEPVQVPSAAAYSGAQGCSYYAASALSVSIWKVPLAATAGSTAPGVRTDTQEAIRIEEFQSPVAAAVRMTCVLEADAWTLTIWAAARPTQAGAVQGRALVAPGRSLMSELSGCD